MNLHFLGLSLYAVSTLTSMAGMSIGLACAVLAGIVGSGGIGAYLRKLGAVWKEEKWMRRYLKASFILTLACAITLIIAEYFPLSYGGKKIDPPVLRDLSKVIYLSLPWILGVSWRELSPSERGRVFRIWLYAFALASFIGCYQYFSGWPRPQPIPESLTPGPEHARYHVTLLFGHHLSTASILIFPFFAFLEYAYRHRDTARWKQALYLLVILLGTLSLVFTYSRILWIALPVGIALWMMLSLSKKAIFICLILSLGAGAALWRTEVVQSRLRSDMGKSQRYDLWEAFLDYAKKRPLTGAGFRQGQGYSGIYLHQKYPAEKSVFAGHAHSNVLEMIGGTGAIGTLSWFLWNGIVFFLFWGVYQNRGLGLYGRAWMCAFLVFHLNGLTQVNFWESKVMHQLMWVILIALAEIQLKREAQK